VIVGDDDAKRCVWRSLTHIVCIGL
jgi:hypothetical protein